MVLRSYLILILLISTNAFASKNDKNACQAEVEFKNIPQSKNQTVKLDRTTTLVIHQFLDSYAHEGVVIATNVLCQKLTGAKYTGSKEEWAGVIKNALETLKAQGATDLKLSLTTDLGKVYKGTESNKEYDFRANFDGNKQVIKNFTLLDIGRNTVYTLSVSGSESIEQKINEEFSRVVGTFKLK